MAYDRAAKPVDRKPLVAYHRDMEASRKLLRIGEIGLFEAGFVLVLLVLLFGLLTFFGVLPLARVFPLLSFLPERRSPHRRRRLQATW